MQFMSAGLFAELPPPDERCKISVGIPVCNEGPLIEACLTAFARQLDLAGTPFPRTAFEVLIFANECTDDTVAQILGFQSRYPDIRLHLIIAQRVAPDSRNVGTARRTVMEAAALRMHGRAGIVATTDGDTVVEQDWLAQTLRHLTYVHAVGGRVLPVPDVRAADHDVMDPALQFEHRYRYAIVQYEALMDPLMHDPWPRHGNHQGASLAVRAEVYRAVGGVPICKTHEDFGLYLAIVRHDFLFRHSLHVRVRTSARRFSRVSDGFASDLSAIDLHLRGERVATVEHPHFWHTLFSGRAALRNGRLHEAAHLWSIPENYIRRALVHGSTFGSALETIENWAKLQGTLVNGERLPIDEALALLQRYVRAASSMAEPTRSIA